jgi:hypothetical protein
MYEIYIAAAEDLFLFWGLQGMLMGLLKFLRICVTITFLVQPVLKNKDLTLINTPKHFLAGLTITNIKYKL